MHVDIILTKASVDIHVFYLAIIHCHLRYNNLAFDDIKHQPVVCMLCRCKCNEIAKMEYTGSSGRINAILFINQAFVFCLAIYLIYPLLVVF